MDLRRKRTLSAEHCRFPLLGCSGTLQSLSFKRREKGIDQRKNGPALCDTPFQENHHYGGYHSKLDEPLQT